MPELRLAKLPDRRLVKHMIIVKPELEQRLRAYADFYQQSYGEAETIETLIPFMLDMFLESDRGFVKAYKDHVQIDSEIGLPRLSRFRREAKRSPVSPPKAE